MAKKQKTKKSKEIVRKEPKKKSIKKPGKKVIKRPKKKPIKRPVKKQRKKVIKKKRIIKKPVRKKLEKKPIKKARKKISRKKRKRKIQKPVRKQTRKNKKLIKKRKAVKKRKPIKKTRLAKKRRPVKKREPKKSRKKISSRRKYKKGDSLEQLFEFPNKVQIMKLFFRNPDQDFLLKESAKNTRLVLEDAKKEIKKLEKIGVLKSRKISSRKALFSINPNFTFFNELKELILKASPVSKERLLGLVKQLGKIKLVLLSGIFVGEKASRADLLIVGNKISQKKLKTFIKKIEVEAGADINCMALSEEEFKYRYGMYDRFIRDLLDEKSEFLINKLDF